jgi:hypothetical protein
MGRQTRPGSAAAAFLFLSVRAQQRNDRGERQSRRNLGLAAGWHHLPSAVQAAGEVAVPVPLRVQGLARPHLRPGLRRRAEFPSARRRRVRGPSGNHVNGPASVICGSWTRPTAVPLRWSRMSAQILYSEICGPRDSTSSSSTKECTVES